MTVFIIAIIIIALIKRFEIIMKNFITRNQENISFELLSKNHLPIVGEWFNRPHVKEWWNDNLPTDELYAKYENRISDPNICVYIICHGGTPIGLIQYSHVNRINDPIWKDEIEGTASIDCFIGEESYLNRGVGSKAIYEFITLLFNEKDIFKVVVDVDKNNKRAIKCFEKVGIIHLNKPEISNSSFNLMFKYRNSKIETHAPFLKKPSDKTSLFKIVTSENFFSMLENDYLYFRRVDTYHDDCRDSDQPDLDKEISNKAKFINNPEYTASNYYASCRSRTYACCFSTENSLHIWEHYEFNDPNTFCLIFDAYKLTNYLNYYLDKSWIIFNNKTPTNFFDFNNGLVSYGDFGDMFMKNSMHPNPIEYVYFKDASKYSEEKEFRFTLSAAGIFKKFVFQDQSELIFPKSIKLEFSFFTAIKMGIITELQLSQKCVDRDAVLKKLMHLFKSKNIEIIIK